VGGDHQGQRRLLPGDDPARPDVTIAAHARERREGEGIADLRPDDQRDAEPEDDLEDEQQQGFWRTRAG
jgi:hypothetical protein